MIGIKIELQRRIREQESVGAVAKSELVQELWTSGGGAEHFTSFHAFYLI